MASWLLYWRLEEAVNAIESGLPLTRAASEQLDRVESGDDAWICSVDEEGHLFTIGRIEVGKVLTQEEAVEEFGDAYPASWHIVGAEETAEIPRRVRLDQMSVSLHGSQLEERSGRLLGQQLQTMRRLDDEGAAYVGRIWNDRTETSRGERWTDPELRAAVEAYLDMLRMEQAGLGYSKAEKRRELRQGRLSSRSDQSIEYRMRNISSVLDDLGLSRVKGYVPAEHVGAGTALVLRRILTDLGAFSGTPYEPTSDRDELDRRASQLSKRKSAVPPMGSFRPKASEQTVVGFDRDPHVASWVRDVAAGVCELCGNTAPFFKKTGEPYLEVHHVVWLANGGPDTIENAVALCPNCHTRCHYSDDFAEAVEALYDRVDRLERAPNLGKEA